MGGFCKAFQDAGFKVLWANENDQHCNKTYHHNFPDTRLYRSSIDDLSVSADKLAPVDVLTAGFPCQAFSVAGRKEGFRDERGRVFFSMMRLLKEFAAERPKILLLENVKNLYTHDKKRTFTKVTQAIQQAGYWFQPHMSQVLNTGTHTDIPVNRERLFMVGLRTDAFSRDHFRFPEPLPAKERRNYRSMLDTKKKADDWYYFKESSQYYPLFKKAMAQGSADSVYLLRRSYVREHTTIEVPTLMANMGGGGHNVPVIEDKYGIRKFTEVECLRFQGMEKLAFPDDLSRTQKYKQIGNAVTVPLVQKLALECRRQLDALESKGQ
jgi:DNA (cytosine-5)-methyltransferase 1